MRRRRLRTVARELTARPRRAARRILGRLRLGARGERAARAYLRRSGYRILAANWGCSRGEIDIVALEGSWLVFVEVKSRVHHPRSPYDPFERIDRAKQLRLVALSRTFVHANTLRLPGLEELNWRYDAIAVLFERIGSVPLYRKKVLHREAAFVE